MPMRRVRVCGVRRARASTTSRPVVACLPRVSASRVGMVYMSSRLSVCLPFVMPLTAIPATCTTPWPQPRMSALGSATKQSSTSLVRLGTGRLLEGMSAMCCVRVLPRIWLLVEFATGSGTCLDVCRLRFLSQFTSLRVGLYLNSPHSVSLSLLLSASLKLSDFFALSLHGS